jgi:hypothetical protein
VPGGILGRQPARPRRRPWAGQQKREAANELDPVAPPAFDNAHRALRGYELRITGEVREEAKGEGKPPRRRHGKFAYRTSLPADADADAEKIDAQLADGILTVRVPKAARARSRRIEIKS